MGALARTAQKGASSCAAKSLSDPAGDPYSQQMAGAPPAPVSRGEVPISRLPASALTGPSGPSAHHRPLDSTPAQTPSPSSTARPDSWASHTCGPAAHQAPDCQDINNRPLHINKNAISFPKNPGIIIVKTAHAVKARVNKLLSHKLHKFKEGSPPWQVSAAAAFYKIYPGNVTAVKDFNLEIADKEFIIFVGPSGCGKSTTLRMIAGLEEISKGEMYIGDRLDQRRSPEGSRHCDGVPELRSVPPHDRVQEHGLWSGAAQDPEGRD